ncbi:hypothetical protein LP420_18705 [Massilia sp. B-10]|nr:hypothetical protein LP420_18705 [Massilia sp. B-10]
MMDAVFYGFTVMLFAAVILMIEGGYLWWSGTHGGGARRIARSLRLMSGGIDAHGEKVSILKQRRYCDNDWLDAFLHRRRLANVRSTACCCSRACAGRWPSSLAPRWAGCAWRCCCCRCIRRRPWPS